PLSIGITISGTAVTTALPTLTISPGNASVATSLVSVNAGTVASGSTLTATLRAKDAASNDLTAGGETVVFSLSGGGSSATVGPTTDHHDGTYSATLTGVLAGSLSRLHASINGNTV